MKVLGIFRDIKRKRQRERKLLTSDSIGSSSEAQRSIGAATTRTEHYVVRHIPTPVDESYTGITVSHISTRNMKVTGVGGVLRVKSDVRKQRTSW